MITHTLIKLYKMGGLYAKTIECWNAKDRAIWQSWMEFKTHFIK